MSNLDELALVAAFATNPSARPKLDELEQALADQIKRLKLEPELGALAEIQEQLVVTNELLELGTKLPEAAFKTLISRHRLKGPLDEALERVSEAHVAALGREGVATRVVGILKSWMDLTIEIRVLERSIQVLRARGELRAETPIAKEDAEPLGDPVATLSATEFGQLIGLGDESVRQRERAGKLFSILHPARKRGREYPVFQSWPEIAGKPLERALAALGSTNGADAYAFFTSVTDLLGDLSPIEVLLGKPLSARKLDADATRLLKAPKEDRILAVEKAAASAAAQLSA